MHIALYEPDIAQNAGAIMRLGACLGVPVHIIEPAGFHWSESGLRRAGLDYAEAANVTRHVSYQRFVDGRPAGRLILLTTAAEQPYTEFRFEADDIVLLGRESAGVPDRVHDRADARLKVPMMDGMRSLNVAVAAAMVIGEALRQTGGFAV
jgi:tRNA (cytidine/uridine-2'-O-)-methyltransferase